MSKVRLTVAEETELRVALDATDPIYYGTTVGALPHPPNDTAWRRVESREPSWGVSVQCRGARDESGDVELPAEAGWGVLDHPGTLPLGIKIIDAVGELPDSNRQFSLEFKFSEFGKGVP